MYQVGNLITYDQKDEEGQWVVRIFETKHEAKQFHKEVYDKNGKIIWNPRATSGTK